jgi:hypothetical protein
MAKKHPNKHIREAIKYAVEKGWRVSISKGHHWGHIWCPLESREGCMFGVYSTPRNPETHARWLRKMIDQCPHAPHPETPAEEETED